MDRCLYALIACVVLSACSMTPTQKKWTGVVAGVLVVGAIAAHQSDSGNNVYTKEDGHLVEIPCNPDC